MNKVTPNQNDKVKHPSMPEWGVGRVLELEQNGEILHIYFSLGGYKDRACAPTCHHNQ
jgi:hypothetical protein